MLLMHQFKTKIHACRQCGQVDEVNVSGQSVGCRRCGIFWICTTVDFLKYAITNWNTKEVEDVS